MPMNLVNLMGVSLIRNSHFSEQTSIVNARAGIPEAAMAEKWGMAFLGYMSKHFTLIATP